MAIYQNTLDELVEIVCKLYLRDWWDGTATGGSSTTIVDTTNRHESDDYFNSMPYAEAYIRTTTDSGAPIGQTRKVSDFTQSSSTVTVNAAYTAAVGAGDTYSIHSLFKRAEVVDAINQAIEHIAENALFWKIDESTITLSADTYEYDLPTTFMYLTEITMADADGDFTGLSIPSSQWRIIHDTTPALALKKDDTQEGEGIWYNPNVFVPVASRALRLRGLVSPAKLSTDSSKCPVTPVFIGAQAAAILFRSRSSLNDPHGYGARADVYQKQADRERVLIVPMSLPIGAKRVQEGG